MRSKIFLLSLTSLFAFTFPAMSAEEAKLNLQSSAFSDGGTMPKKYTGDGEDVSPPLSWGNGPANTKSYALSVEDPDAPSGTWWHWILFNMSNKTTSLGENVPKNATLAQDVLQGKNDFHKPGYNGPAPPAGKLHHYIFKIRALDTMLNLPANADKKSFSAAINGHVIGEGQVTAVYRR